MERRGSSGIASSSGASGGAATFSLEELCNVGGRLDAAAAAPTRTQQQRPLPALPVRRRGLKLAACLGLALMTLLWIWAWYPPGEANPSRGTQKGHGGPFRTFRLRYSFDPSYSVPCFLLSVPGCADQACKF